MTTLKHLKKKSRKTEDVKSFADRFTEAHTRGEGYKDRKTGKMIKKNYRLHFRGHNTENEYKFITVASNKTI